MPTIEKRVEEIKADLAEVFEKVRKLPLEVQVEIAANMRSIGATATTTVDGVYKGDTLIRPGLKHILRSKARPAEKGWLVLGRHFEARFLPVTMQVLDQKALRIEQPAIVEKFTRPIESERLNFLIRSR
jgi:hypothetical protein